MKKMLYFILFLVALCGCMKNTEFIQKDTVENNTEFIADLNEELKNDIPLTADNIPITRAAAAKMIALAFNDSVTVAKTDFEIEFTDVSEKMWYAPYINIVYIQGYMSGTGKEFLPEEPLTVNQAQLLLDKINPNNKIKIKITEQISDKPISYELWLNLYMQTLEAMEEKSVKKEEITVLCTPANDSECQQWSLISDKGTYRFDGIMLDAYIDCKIEVYTKDGDILAFSKLLETEPVITGVYLQKYDKNYVDIFVNGAKRTYTTKENMVLDTSIFTSPIIDLRINQGNIVEIRAIDDKISNEIILRADEEYIELKSGKKEVFEDIKFYSNIDGKLRAKNIKNFIVGTDIGQYYLKDGKICAAVITKDYEPRKIRVAIGNTGFSSLIHDEIKLKSNGEYIVKYGDKEKKIKSGETLNINAENDKEYFENADRIYLYSENINSRLELESIKRGQGIPNYRGVIEIAKQQEGYSIVNELPLEEYLYHVVPSEMPASYGIEAAKVQAVTARSYAYNQIFSNKYYKYGANVDDSTQSQVYNNTLESKTSTQAVDDTRGKVLSYNGAVISANFFSTSAGVTANSGEVWMNTDTKEFPNSTPKYLQSQSQYISGDYGDLSKEENAERFFKSTDIESYDNQFSWFRWNVCMSAKQLSNSINSIIKSRYEANKWAIKTLVDGVYRSREIEGIGILKDIEIVKRGEGGNIMEIILVGSEHTVKVLTEYNVRVLLKPADINGKIILNLNNGSSITNYSLMPSAFFTIDKVFKENGELESITFYGGGNGHGVGMSQNGVKTMSDMGMSYDKILEHYYSGTKIGNIY